MLQAEALLNPCKKELGSERRPAPSALEPAEPAASGAGQGGRARWLV